MVIEEDLKANIKEYIKTYNLRLGKKEALSFKENVEKIKRLFEKRT